MAQTADIKTGSVVEWPTAGGAVARSLVVGVSRDGISVRSSDGFIDYHPTGLYTSLDDIVRRWTVVDHVDL